MNMGRSTYFTEGRQFYPGFQFPIYYTNENCFADGEHKRDHYKMIFNILKIKYNILTRDIRCK